MWNIISLVEFIASSQNEMTAYVKKLEFSDKKKINKKK